MIVQMVDSAALERMILGEYRKFPNGNNNNSNNNHYIKSPNRLEMPIVSEEREKQFVSKLKILTTFDSWLATPKSPKHTDVFDVKKSCKIRQPHLDTPASLMLKKL